jgi:hypothetical protein
MINSEEGKEHGCREAAFGVMRTTRGRLIDNRGE